MEARPTLNSDYVQRGNMLFLDPRISGDGQHSCVGCHPNMGSDGKFYSNGVEVEANSAEARRTPELRGLWQSAPYLWDGSQKTLRGALERMLAIEMRGANLAPKDVAALEQFLLSIKPFDNGKIELDGTPIQPVRLAPRRGSEVFVAAKCVKCHQPPSFSHRFKFDVGTGGKWSVPGLRNVSNQSRWGHDGRWETLEEAVEAMLIDQKIELSEREKTQLVEYLKLI